MSKASGDVLSQNVVSTGDLLSQNVVSTVTMKSVQTDSDESDASKPVDGDISKTVSPTESSPVSMLSDVSNIESRDQHLSDECVANNVARDQSEAIEKSEVSTDLHMQSDPTVSTGPTTSTDTQTSNSQTAPDQISMDNSGVTLGDVSLEDVSDLPSDLSNGVSRDQPAIANLFDVSNENISDVPVVSETANSGSIDGDLDMFPMQIMSDGGLSGELKSDSHIPINNNQSVVSDIAYDGLSDSVLATVSHMMMALSDKVSDVVSPDSVEMSPPNVSGATDKPEICSSVSQTSDQVLSPQIHEGIQLKLPESTSETPTLSVKSVSPVSSATSQSGTCNSVSPTSDPLLAPEIDEGIQLKLPESTSETPTLSVKSVS
eukprot:919552_1